MCCWTCQNTFGLYGAQSTTLKEESCVFQFLCSLKPWEGEGTLQQHELRAPDSAVIRLSSQFVQTKASVEILLFKNLIT